MALVTAVLFIASFFISTPTSAYYISGQYRIEPSTPVYAQKLNSAEYLLNSDVESSGDEEIDGSGERFSDLSQIKPSYASRSIENSFESYSKSDYLTKTSIPYLGPSSSIMENTASKHPYTSSPIAEIVPSPSIYESQTSSMQSTDIYMSSRQSLPGGDSTSYETSSGGMESSTNSLALPTEYTSEIMTSTQSHQTSGSISFETSSEVISLSTNSLNLPAEHRSESVNSGQTLNTVTATPSIDKSTYIHMSSIHPTGSSNSDETSSEIVESSTKNIDLQNDTNVPETFTVPQGEFYGTNSTMKSILSTNTNTVDIDLVNVTTEQMHDKTTTDAVDTQSIPDITDSIAGTNQTSSTTEVVSKQSVPEGTTESQDHSLNVSERIDGHNASQETTTHLISTNVSTKVDSNSSESQNSTTEVISKETVPGGTTESQNHSLNVSEGIDGFSTSTEATTHRISTNGSTKVGSNSSESQNLITEAFSKETVPEGTTESQNHSLNVSEGIDGFSTSPETTTHRISTNGSTKVGSNSSESQNLTSEAFSKETVPEGTTESQNHSLNVSEGIDGFSTSLETTTYRISTNISTEIVSNSSETPNSTTESIHNTTTKTQPTLHTTEVTINQSLPQSTTESQNSSLNVPSGSSPETTTHLQSTDFTGHSKELNSSGVTTDSSTTLKSTTELNKGGGVFSEVTNTIPTTSEKVYVEPEINITKAPDKKYWIRTQLKMKPEQFTDTFQQDMQSNLQKLYKNLLENSTRVKRSLNSTFAEDNQLSTIEKTEDLNSKKVQVKILNITFDAINHVVHLIYAVYVDKTPILAVAISKKVNKMTKQEIENILGYKVIEKAQAVVEVISTPASRKYDPSKKYETHDWIIFVVVGVFSAVLFIIIITFILYKKYCRKNDHPLTSSPSLSLSTPSSMSPKGSTFGRLNRQKIFGDKSYHINVSDKDLERMKQIDKKILNEEDQTQNNKMAPTKPHRKSIESNNTIVELHETKLLPKKNKENRQGGHINRAFEDDDTSSDANDYGNYQVAPEKPPKKYLLHKQPDDEESEIDFSRRARKPADEVVPELPIKTKKLPQEQLFNHVTFSGPMSKDNKNNYDPTILNHEEKSRGPYPPSEIYNMQATPRIIPIANCTTTESSDDILEDASDDEELKPNSNILEIKTKINELLDESFSFANIDNEPSDRGRKNISNNRVEPMVSAKRRSKSLHRDREIASAPSHRRKTGRNSPPKVKKMMSVDGSNSEENIDKIPNTDMESILKNARRKRHPNHGAKVVWTPYTAGDEIARTESLHSTRNLSSYLKEDDSKVFIPSKNSNRNLHRAKSEPRVNSASPHSDDKSFQKDEIDIVKSLKSIEFEPAESVIKAIKDELLKYENQ